MGIKLGDKTGDVVVKNLGAQLGETKVLTDEYLTYYQKNAVGVYDSS
jgi:hypothetical protein